MNSGQPQPSSNEQQNPNQSESKSKIVISLFRQPQPQQNVQQAPTANQTQQNQVVIQNIPLNTPSTLITLPFAPVNNVAQYTQPKPPQNDYTSPFALNKQSAYPQSQDQESAPRPINPIQDIEMFITPPDNTKNLQNAIQSNQDININQFQNNEQPIQFKSNEILNNDNIGVLDHQNQQHNLQSQIISEAETPAIITIPLPQNSIQEQTNLNTSPVKLRIPIIQQQQVQVAVAQTNKNKVSFIPPQLKPFVNLQGSAQNGAQQQPLSPFQVYNYPQTPIHPFSQIIPQTQPKPKKLQIPLSDVYNITNRQLAMKLDPKSLKFNAQLILSFELSPTTEEWLSTLGECHKVAIEMKFLAKNIQVTDIFELNGLERIKKFNFNDEAQIPKNQAQIHQNLFPNVSQLADIDIQERSNYNQELQNGTIQMNRKYLGLRPRKQSVQEMLIKFKPNLRLLIEYQCDQITKGSTLRYSSYRDTETQTLERYIYTIDQNSECWIPQLVGTEQKTSPWLLRIAVPEEYMVICSGVQTQRIEDNQHNALHIYEVDKASQEKIGFVCCKFPKITTIEKGKCQKGQYGCFLSVQKQNCFNQQYVVEVMDYLQNLLGVSDQLYPCKQDNFVFLPNLLPKKFPKQCISFGEGLHLFDEQILVRPNQIDKRHHFYKHIASAITFDFFGSKVREATPGDLWLLTAIKERIGDRMKKKKCGMLLHKYQVMRSIEILYKQMKHGAETMPLQYQSADDKQSSGQSQNQLPNEQFLSDIFYRKCGLLMHMIESSIDEQNLDKIMRGIYADALEQNDGLLSQFLFRKKFKKICGMHPIVYYKNWIWATSCPELELTYEFSKRNNSLDLTLKQTSAVQYGQTEHQNLSQKLDRIFSSQNIQGEISQTLDSLFIDIKSAARRWFIGSINIVIYQIEGNGGDIIPQQHKMSLKEFKSTSTSHIPLQGKVKRTTHNRKKEDQVYTIEQKIQSDFGQFKMNEFELEDYPSETKNIFQDLDSNPVLWIRVDPDMEFIRKVKVVQEKRNNWLFQLLREQDIIGQIEAVRRLHIYNEELVYEILKTVSTLESFFYKVRKEVLKALKKMEIYTFNKFISHEMFLLKVFNTKRLLPGDAINTFYRENDFSNILEYFMERALLTAISKCKEEKLVLTLEKQKEVDDKMQIRKTQVAQENGMQAQAEEPVSEPTPNANAICLTISDNKFIRQRRSKARFDESQYKCTTETVAKMLMRVLEQNDNSENNFDDSFYLKDLIASLGRIDNVQMMPAIAKEIYRQFKLDQISNSSPNFSITIGAIKGYFNLRKQFLKFKTEKLVNMEYTLVKNQQNFQIIDNFEDNLKDMKIDIDKIFVDSNQPLDIRLFIFQEEVKQLFKYKNQSFTQALVTTLKMIEGLQARGEIMFAFYSYRNFVLYLEQKKLTNEKISIIDAYQLQNREEIKTRIWALYKLPHAYLSHEFTYWTKRLIKRLYSNQIPDCAFRFQFETDPNWSQTENEILQQQTVQQQTVEQIPMLIPQQQQHIQQGVTGIRSNQIQINYNNQQSQPQQHQLTIQETIDMRAQKILQERERAQSFGISGGAFKISIATNRNNQRIDDEEMVSDNSQNVAAETNEMAGQQQDQNIEDDESIIDPFADIKFQNPIMQKCWDVLGKLYYHYEATDFLEPITAEAFGQQMYDDYCSVIENPMDIHTIMERMKADYYLEQSNFDSHIAKNMFKRDVMLIFQNCREFNEKGTDIVKSANRLTIEFNRQWAEQGFK